MSTALSPPSAEVGGRGTWIWEHADGGGPAVLGPASEVNAVIPFFFLLWRVLRSPLRTARAGAYTAPAEVNMLRYLQALVDHNIAAASSRTECSWVSHSLQSERVTSFSASPLLQGT